MKEKICLAWIVLCFFFLSFPKMVLASKLKIGLYATAGPDLRFAYNNKITVKNIPLEIRNIPVHRDDQDCKANEGPIEKDTLKLKFSKVDILSCGLGIQINTSKITLRCGGKLMVSTENPQIDRETIGSEQMAERNYRGSGIGTDERGYGHALTYYGIELGKGGILNPKLYIDLLIDFPKNHQKDEDLFAFIEYSIRKHILQAESGWDRYDQIEPWRHYKLANLIEHSVSIGLAGLMEIEENKAIFIKLFGGAIFYTAEKYQENIEIKADEIYYFLGLEISFQVIKNILK